MTPCQWHAAENDKAEKLYGRVQPVSEDRRSVMSYAAISATLRVGDGICATF